MVWILWPGHWGASEEFSVRMPSMQRGRRRTMEDGHTFFDVPVGLAALHAYDAQGYARETLDAGRNGDKNL